MEEPIIFKQCWCLNNQQWLCSSVVPNPLAKREWNGKKFEYYLYDYAMDRVKTSNPYLIDVFKRPATAFEVAIAISNAQQYFKQNKTAN